MRARALELAAQLLVRELDVDTVAALGQKSLRDALNSYESGCADYLSDLAQSGSTGLDRAAADFCALFVVSAETSPFASSWLGGDPAETGAALAGDVQRWMASLGVDLAPGPWGNLPPDHIAVLLGLVALALHHPAPDGPTLAREIVARSLSWLPRFASAVRARSSNPLYRAAAQLAADAVA